ncbi:MAG: hypothetical protein H6629_14920 [Calditrichae bacterium]|nr:hypothetical protein [Calditrichia bacterium]
MTAIITGKRSSSELTKASIEITSLVAFMSGMNNSRFFEMWLILACQLSQKGRQPIMGGDIDKDGLKEVYLSWGIV